MTDFGFDAQRALDAVRRFANDAPAQIADGLGRLVRDAPPERLEQLMLSPARKPILDAIFWRIPKQLDSGQAAGLTASIRWCITGRPDEGIDIYQLEILDGSCSVVREAEAPDPRLTITLDGVDFLRLVTGNLDPMKAYFRGQIKLVGDVMVAAKIASLFRIPGGGTGNGNGANGPQP